MSELALICTGIAFVAGFVVGYAYQLLHPNRRRIELEREIDGRWIAEITDVPGAIAYGDTPHRALLNALEIADSAKETS